MVVFKSYTKFTNEGAIILFQNDSFQFRVCVRKKKLKLDYSVLIGRPHNMYKTAHNMGPKLQELAFFHKPYHLSIWMLCKKFLKNFQFGPF